VTAADSRVWARLLLLVAALSNAALLWIYHDRYWFVVDEGNYAHIAERLLSGDVLHRDVQDLHPGFINFVNTAAFGVFGTDLVSLRYPLMAAMFAVSLVVWWLLARRSLLLATLASVAVNALGVVQFLNPTAHWYCLFATAVLIGWLEWVSAGPTRTLGAGMLIGMVALFRQLTGLWVGMAVVVVLLRERSDAKHAGDRLVSRGLILAMLAMLVGYLMFAGGPETSGILLLATWPAAVLLVELRDTAASNRISLTILWQLAVGAALAALPLVVYHVTHRSLSAWVDDTVFASINLTTLPLFDGASLILLPAAGVLSVVRATDAAALVNGAYWIVLPLLIPLNGWLLLRALRRHSELPILPIVAAFYSLVTLHLAGAVYLSYSIGLTMTAVLWFAAAGPPRRVTLAAAGAIALSIVSVAFHAGQPSSRTPFEAARGVRSADATPARCAQLARASLRVGRRECETYGRLVAEITAEASPGSQILAIPSDAEFYFLADRANPFRFYNTALGVRSSEDVAAVLDALEHHPPAVVTYRPADKYNTDASREIMAAVQSRYERFNTIDGVELYRPAPHGRRETE
jgi:hypothetical protein